MSTISINDTVGDVIARQPGLSHAFELADVDYCCGGKKTIGEVCNEKGLEPKAFIASLETAAKAEQDGSVVNVSAMTLSDLATHVEQTHHAYLREELPRLEKLTSKVAYVHGIKDSRLSEVRDELLAFAKDMTSHMIKEEQVLFPVIRNLDSLDAARNHQEGTVANPIRQMEKEHNDAGDSLKRMRALTDGYTPPGWACNTYRAMIDGLAKLERDTHQHVHKEENVLFPKAIRKESEITQQTA